MVDECVVRPIVGEVTDPVTGVVTPEYGDPVYAGRCKLQNQRLRYPSNPEAGEHVWTVGPMELHLPVPGTGAVATGQHVEITGSVDESNVGRVFRVRIGDRKTFQSALRLLLEEVVH